MILSFWSIHGGRSCSIDIFETESQVIIIPQPPKLLFLDFRVSRSVEMERSLYLTAFNLVELDNDLRVITLSNDLTVFYPCIFSRLKAYEKLRDSMGRHIQNWILCGYTYCDTLPVIALLAVGAQSS